ncbi:2-amino-4-hydroxy-6-hydroxymethyldihydropteridine diphosphokinase [Parasphingorhabdus halotolerans]|uniref:2-amino-4-hydroxy-6-hydroxymethyldihydropteridine pyrophosphokinase n=1 Tax=Parasphingorhabdus halotolerans TaxID=2725558 RepID=A0A6H2DRQ8_9SPHN|nr:2-amino-4-hydroxy-6-hydroxymethyldihydropteridine diphosphokinase [Parasphingorhabdus halotolerans]
MAKSSYLIALGSNQRHARIGPPAKVVRSAFGALNDQAGKLCAQSQILFSNPVGPSSRRYANAVAIIVCPDNPLELLGTLQNIESQYGTRRGQRWSRRVLDLDIIMWSGGPFLNTSPDLIIPHIAMHERAFVLQPANEIARDWRDPITGLAIRHLASREKRGKPLDREANHH